MNLSLKKGDCTPLVNTLSKTVCQTKREGEGKEGERASVRHKALLTMLSGLKAGRDERGRAKSTKHDPYFKICTNIHIMTVSVHRVWISICFVSDHYWCSCINNLPQVWLRYTFIFQQAVPIAVFILNPSNEMINNPFPWQNKSTIGQSMSYSQINCKDWVHLLHTYNLCPYQDVDQRPVLIGRKTEDCLRNIPDWSWRVWLSNITRCWLDTSQSGWDIH